MKKNFFEWIAECCVILGKDKMYGLTLLKDPNWAAAWDDGLTEEEAVKEFKVMYPNGYENQGVV